MTSAFEKALCGCDIWVNAGQTSDHSSIAIKYCGPFDVSHDESLSPIVNRLKELTGYPA